MRAVLDWEEIWFAGGSGDIGHIVPLDAIGHDQDSDCPCGPTMILLQDGDMLFAHYVLERELV